ncbi:MAG TPA: hypothetical protein VLA19_26015 [Herpetosiphonaceae bacterium]|nr:hypothetical protein [Herpetosiphonaceae bacterium]
MRKGWLIGVVLAALALVAAAVTVFAGMVSGAMPVVVGVVLLAVVSTALPVLLGMLGMAVVAWVLIERDDLSTERHASLAAGEAA